MTQCHIGCIIHQWLLLNASQDAASTHTGIERPRPVQNDLRLHHLDTSPAGVAGCSVLGRTKDGAAKVPSADRDRFKWWRTKGLVRDGYSARSYTWMQGWRYEACASNPGPRRRRGRHLGTGAFGLTGALIGPATNIDLGTCTHKTLPPWPGEQISRPGVAHLNAMGAAALAGCEAIWVACGRTADLLAAVSPGEFSWQGIPARS